VLQPIGELAAICREQRIPMHTDAVQAVGKIPVDFSELNVDAMSFSAHKLHGPVGIGGLILRHQLSVSPILHGGFQQAGLRPGTEPVALVVGLSRAMELAIQSIAEEQTRVGRRRDRLAQLLCEGFPDAVINGLPAARLPQTLNIAFPGVNRQALVMALDMAGVACSTGSACASGSSEPSPVLQAMSVPNDVLEGSIRLSLSAATTETELDEAARRILNVLNNLRRPNSTRSRAVPPRFAAPKSL
jgi:cysteine desulfurase